MAKKSTNKQKKSKSLTSKRRSTWKALERVRLVEKFTVVTCPECKAPKLNSSVCAECGFQRGRKVLDLDKNNTKKAVTKIKA